MNLRKFFYVLCAVAVLLGVGFRVYNLRQSGLFLYDEGFYLQHNLPILEFIDAHPSKTFSDALTSLQWYFRFALASGKFLWFMLMDSRFFIGGLHDWGYPKVVACFFGILLLPLIYLFSRRYYGSRDTALLSTALSALLPGLVFYSRIGLQEALSAVLVLSGFYFYCFSKRFGPRVILAGILFAAAFFANYRLIILPGILICLELWEGSVLGKGVAARKFVWTVLTFFAGVVLVGNLLDAANTRIIFAWVFHQESMAGGSFSWVNFLSHPFYLFLLETVFFAGAFFASGWLFLGRNRDKALPFVLVLVQMVIFSVTSEKGARYLCVMLPFAVMSVAFLIMHCFRSLPGIWRYAAVIFTVVTAGFMSLKSLDLARASSAYEEAVRLVEKHDPSALILSTQDQVQSLYVRPYSRVKGLPARFDRLVPLYEKGYRYVIIDPQAYVGLTNGYRFSPHFVDYLAFIDDRLRPVAILPHMNHAMLERFVCEHNENLITSIRFLWSPEWEKYASIRIYDISGLVPQMNTLYLELLKRRR